MPSASAHAADVAGDGDEAAGDGDGDGAGVDGGDAAAAVGDEERCESSWRVMFSESEPGDDD